MGRPRPPRKVVVDPNAGGDGDFNHKNCPPDSHPSPGFPLFPREKFQWMKNKYEPKYIRVHKIVLGQELLAEWPTGFFRGNPETMSMETLSELWGKGTYKVELMSSASADRPVERIYQNTVEVEDGEEDMPFPGVDRSAKVLAEDGEDDDDDDDEDDGGASFFGGSRHGSPRTGMPHPGMPRMPPQQGMPPQGNPHQQPGMPGMRHGMYPQQYGYPPYGYPPYGYPPPQPQPEPTKLTDYAPLVVAIGTVVTGITAAIITSSEKREAAAAAATAASAAASREAAAQQQTFLIAMLGRNEQTTERVLTMANSRPQVDPAMMESMASIKAELVAIRAEKSRGGGDPNDMDKIDKYLALFDKIGDRVSSGGGGGEDTSDKLLSSLPIILAIIQAARGGPMPPQLPHQTPQQPASQPIDTGAAAGYPAQGYPSQ